MHRARKKWGGYGKRAFLALAAASAIFCGGLVNVGASVQSETISAGTTSNRVLTVDNTDDAAQLNKVILAAREDKLVTKDNIGGQLTDYAKASDLSAKADANDVYSKTAAEDTFATKTELGSYAKSADVYSRTDADGKFATNEALRNLNDTVDNKADEAAVTALEGRVVGVEGKVTTLEGTVGDVSNRLVKDVNDLNTALGNKADQSALVAATDRITANEGNITDLQTTTAGQADAIKDLKDKTTNISYDSGKKSTFINGIEIGSNQVDMGGKALTDVESINGTKIGTNETGVYISQDGSIWGNLKTVDTQVKTNADNIEMNKNDITALNNKVGKVGTGTYLDPNKTVGENLGLLNVGLKQEVEDRKTAVDAEKTEREKADATLSSDIKKETSDREAADAEINKKIGSINNIQTEYVKEEQTISQNLTKLDNKLKDTNDRTGGITRNDAESKTIIEKKVTVDSNGNVTAEGKLKAGSVDAGAITTTGAVNAGSLIVTDASNLKGDVTMDKTLSVTGDTKLGALNVTGESSLKDTQVNGTLITTGKATFKEAVEMDKGLTVTSGDTTLQNTDVKGALNVTGESSLKNTTVGGTLGVTGEATFKDKVTMEKDLEVKGELKTDKISMKNTDTDPDGTIHRSATTITADGITHNGEVEKSGVITKSQFTHTEEGSETYAKKGNTANWTETRSDVKADGVTTKVEDSKKNRTNTSQTADGIKGYATDKDGNKTYTKVTATENSFQVQDKDGKNKNHQVNTMGSSVTEIKNDEGKTTKTEQTAENITNTAKDGTIKNDAKDIVNNASGNISNKSQTMDTTVTGKATESYGSLDTTVNGNETHIVKGTKTETVDGKVTENYNAGQATKVTGNQDIHVTGKQTNTVEGGQENIISGGQINNITGDQTTTISGTQTTTATDINRNASSGMIDTIDNAYGTNTETKVAGKTTTDVSIKGTGEKGQYIRGANESRDYLIKGTLKNSETKTAEATSTKITDGNGKTSSTIQDVTQISGSVTDGTNTSVSNVKANSIDSAVTDGSSISTINQKKNSITSQVTDGTTITKTEQDTKNITNTAKDGTITNDAKDIVNNASGNMTNTVGGDLTTTVSGNELHEVTGKQTNKIDGDQENTIGGNQTTTVTGDISNKAENITNEANTKLTDKVGENTRVLDSEGITDTVGGSTFKQRIDKIMMESKDVSIKAEETLTNEAKVITNKASEVINNEAVNINNTATGIITSKASEIKNQADKLISNKVGENTWENMENGKITTSIKDGAKQNLTQSDAAGTTQSTVDGGKSTVTIQNADGLADAVTDGTNTSVQNQTASAIAAAVKDGAGNENASVANATTSVNTIKSGSKANTVISTADGTSFINSEAAAPVGDGTEVKTTIKGNTITTGKVTMDYAEVMKDLGVRGNANITGKTTTGSLEVTGTSTLKGDVTMGSNATVKKDLTVEGNTNLKNTKVDGTLDVTQKATFGDSVSIAKDLSVDGNATIKGDVTAKSYKVGDKTYISAAGINANDQKITNVADGSISEGSKDAVNGGQLYGVKNDLEGKVNKVGANAAAMANLHPMEFDPDSKWNIAAAIGNYGSETAAALGAFYRPNDDVMVNLSTAFGTGENMVGGGVSVRLGKGGNKLSREENNALKDQVNDLTARMDALLSVLNPNMSKDFPDVPENHWAYEAVSRLAGNDIVQGYPDGEFHGERTMTRYEMAEIIYNALSRGAEAERELVEEFKPELQAMAASEKATAEKAEG